MAGEIVTVGSVKLQHQGRREGVRRVVAGVAVVGQHAGRGADAQYPVLVNIVRIAHRRVRQRADIDAVMDLQGHQRRIRRRRRRRVGAELANRLDKRPLIVTGDGVGIIIAVDGQRVIGVRHRLDIVGVQRQRRADLDLVAGAGLEIAAHHRQPGAGCGCVGVGGAKERRRCRHGDGRAVGRDVRNGVGTIVVERSRNGDAGAAGHFLEGVIHWRAGDVLHLDRVRRHVEGHPRADQEIEVVFQVDLFHIEN